MRKVDKAPSGCNPEAVNAFFDKIEFATRRGLTDVEELFLRKHCRSVDVRRAEPPRDFEWIVTIVLPNSRAQRRLADIPGLVLRSVEIALEVLFKTQAQAKTVAAFHNDHLVYARHGQAITTQFGDTTYTARKGHGQRVVYYGDRRSKTKPGQPCFKIEVRCQGLEALRRNGLEVPAALAGFDHVAFWRRRLKRMSFYEFWPERLGRNLDNRASSKRRQIPAKPEVISWLSLFKRDDDGKVLRDAKGKVVAVEKKLTYDRDRRRGQLLYHVYGLKGDEPIQSLQHFVDNYGRGPWLKRIDEAKAWWEAVIISIGIYANRSCCPPDSDFDHDTVTDLHQHPASTSPQTAGSHDEAESRSNPDGQETEAVQNT